MKKTVRKFTILIAFLTILTSCESFGNVINSFDNSNSTSTEISQNSNSSTTETSQNSNDVSSESNPFISEPVDGVDNFYKKDTNPYKNTALSDTWDVKHLESVGSQNILVVPVRFTNSPNYGTDATIKNNINKVFFGQSSDTGWESVASYYAKSSFGNFTLTGEVTNVFETGMSTSQLDQKAIDNYNYWDQTHYVLEDIYNTYTSNVLKSFDQNSDGYVDAIFLVYLAPFGSSEVFWAYQYYWNRQANVSKPVFSVYAWASYAFMYEDPAYTAANPAAHTFIHEFGHVLGLDDYYDYDTSSSPLGGKDMMDYNIGDHNMHSKYLLNWGLPYVPTGDADITLRPAESSGDFIIINNGWNGHVFDEYLLIEYYTPTGLNAKDAFGEGYGPSRSKSKNFDDNGVRIFHVDARLRHGGRWTNEINASGNGTDYGTSNTPSDFRNNLKRIHLLDAAKGTSTWYHSARKQADNNALFKTGATINGNEWKDYLFSSNNFNDGSAINYALEIGEMTNSGVTIKLRVI